MFQLSSSAIHPTGFNALRCLRPSAFVAACFLAFSAVTISFPVSAQTGSATEPEEGTHSHAELESEAEGYERQAALADEVARERMRLGDVLGSRRAATVARAARRVAELKRRQLALLRQRLLYSSAPPPVTSGGSS